MMNVDERILMEAIEMRMRQHEDARYPDDYCDLPAEPPATPVRPPTPRISLKPDELALHQKLLEIANANAPVPAETYYG